MPVGFIPPMLEVLQDRQVTAAEISWFIQQTLPVIITAVVMAAFQEIAEGALSE